MENKYYLYIEDSGKFKNFNDKHIVYSFILFDKKGRKNFNRIFKYNKKAVVEKAEIKGKEFLNKLNAKKKEPLKRIKYELMIKSGEEAIACGSVIWCKEKSQYDDFNIDNKTEMDKKIWMISTIIKKLAEQNKIETGSTINVFLDNEPVQDAEYIKSKLNENYCEYSGIIRYLRYRQINIEKVEYLDSKLSLPIQYVDILAHSTFKLFDNPTKVQLYSSIIDLYVNGLYVIFQGFIMQNKLNDVKCDCRTMESA